MTISNTVLPKAKNLAKKPNFYKAVFINDNETPMNFVMWVLENIFSKSKSEANRIMLNAHRNGKETAGAFTYEVCEQKTTDSMSKAQIFGFPLIVEMEPL